MQNFISIKAARAALTGTGGTNRGVLTVTSVAPFFVGAYGWLRSSVAGPTRIRILKIDTTANSITVQTLPDNIGKTSTGQYDYNRVSYQPSDISAFLVADGAVISTEEQVVAVEYSYIKPTG